MVHPYCKAFSQLFTMSLFWFLWTADQRMGKDVPSYKTDISVVQFSSMHQRCTIATLSLPSEYTKQQGEEDVFITWIIPGL